MPGTPACAARAAASTSDASRHGAVAEALPGRGIERRRIATVRALPLAAVVEIAMTRQCICDLRAQRAVGAHHLCRARRLHAAAGIRVVAGQHARVDDDDGTVGNLAQAVDDRRSQRVSAT